MHKKGQSERGILPFNKLSQPLTSITLSVEIRSKQQMSGTLSISTPICFIFILKCIAFRLNQCLLKQKKTT